MYGVFIVRISQYEARGFYSSLKEAKAARKALEYGALGSDMALHVVVHRLDATTIVDS